MGKPLQIKTVWYSFFLKGTSCHIYRNSFDIVYRPTHSFELIITFPVCWWQDVGNLVENWNWTSSFRLEEVIFPPSSKKDICILLLKRWIGWWVLGFGETFMSCQQFWKFCTVKSMLTWDGKIRTRLFKN